MRLSSMRLRSYAEMPTALTTVIQESIDQVMALREFTLGTALVRFGMAASGLGAAGVVLDGAGAKTGPYVAVGFGVAAVLLALVVPDSPATIAAMGVFGGAWLLGVHDQSRPLLVALLAVLLYGLHTLAALAVAVPRYSRIERTVGVGWAAHCVPGLVLAVVLALLLARVGHPTGSLSLVVIGLIGVLLVAGSISWLIRSR